MSSRADMDRPASVTAALIGVLLIAITIPYFAFGGGGSAATYDITWSEAASATGQAASSPGTGTAIVEVRVDDRQPSTASIRFSPCADGAVPPVSQPATISWILTEGGEEKGRGTASCDDAGPFVVELAPQPDVGSVEASSATEAERQAYAAGDNQTVTFRLSFTWARSGGLPLGPQQPFSTTGQLEVREWRAIANEQGQEAPR